jgi:hypothetical protein
MAGSKLRSGIALAAALLLSSTPVPVKAQASSGDVTPGSSPETKPRDPNGWEFTFVPYGWFTAVSGDLTVNGASAPFDASFGDIVDDLNIALMGQFEVRKGAVGGFVNVVYSDLGASSTVGPFQLGPSGRITVGPAKVDSSMTLLSADVGVFVRTVDLQLNGGLAEGGSRLIIEPYAGARIWYLDSEIRIPGQDRVFKLTSSDTWADAIVGFRSQWEITDRWNVTLIADIGGFVGGSTVTANGILLGGYRFGLFEGRDANAVFGYRILYDDYSTGSGANEVGLDLAIHGPVLGLAIQF